MECPRCRFYQPKDAFCANCGIHIAGYRRSRRKRILILGLSSLPVWLLAGYLLSEYPLEAFKKGWRALSGVTGRRPDVTVLPYRSGMPGAPLRGKGFVLPEKRKRRRPPPQTSVKQGGSSPQQGSAPAAARERKEPGVPTASAEGAARPAGDSRKSPGPPPRGRVRASREKRPGDEAAGASGVDEEESGALSAVEWFNRGQELGDGSSEEEGYYEKALQIDPTFAPAHYFLGVIHYDRGEDGKALASFRQFYNNATEEEKKEYPVSGYYPVEEISSRATEARRSPSREAPSTEEEPFAAEEESFGPQEEESPATEEELSGAGEESLTAKEASPAAEAEEPAPEGESPATGEGSR